jgi:superfamily II DNA/RNA helicase
MNEFKKGNVKVLIATDVSARGIDIPSVDYVINYDLPEQPENYVHRVGRTGRGTQKGIAVSFCSDEEKPVLEEIQQYLDKPIAVLKLSAGDYAQTLEFTTDAPDDLGALMREIQEFESRAKEERQKIRARKKAFWITPESLFLWWIVAYSSNLSAMICPRISPYGYSSVGDVNVHHAQDQLCLLVSGF